MSKKCKNGLTMQGLEPWSHGNSPQLCCGVFPFFWINFLSRFMDPPKVRAVHPNRLDDMVLAKKRTPVATT